MSVTNENKWHMDKGVSIAVILTIFVQSAGAVWWASSVNTQVSQLGTAATEYAILQEKEDLRQWERINSNEVNSQLTLSLQQTTQAILERVERGLSEARTDIRKQNELMRDYLVEK